MTCNGHHGSIILYKTIHDLYSYICMYPFMKCGEDIFYCFEYYRQGCNKDCHKYPGFFP